MPQSPLAADLRRIMRGRWRVEAPLAPLTTMRVGGLAYAVCCPEDRADLQALLRYASRNSLPVMTLGQGSNILFPDDGWPGIVIMLQDMAEEYRLDNGLLEVGAGFRLPKLVAQTTRQGWAGLEALEGIPGSVGGALTMNAGTSMGSIGPLVVEVEVATLQGEFARIGPEQLNFSYRSSALQRGDLIAISGKLLLKAGNAEELTEQVRRYRARRRQTQPLSTYNSGSIFRNPPGDYAARLIEACGAKGRRVGGAVISTLHANFIVNERNAAASDILELMAEVRREVYQKFGVLLQPELCLIGSNREVWRRLNADMPSG